MRPSYLRGLRAGATFANEQVGYDADVAGGRDLWPTNAIGGWYGLKRGFRRRFGVYIPPLAEALGLVEVAHNPGTIACGRSDSMGRDAVELSPSTRNAARTRIVARFRCTLVAALTCAACSSEPVSEARSGGAASDDSAFAELQDRGASLRAMGVDQYTSAHRFDDLPDGGRIELQRQAEDSAGVERIRAHLRHIAQVFAQGDFQIPGFVHDTAHVPGTEVMREKRAVIEYEFGELPLGGEVRIRSTDPAAVEAIHAFLAFQRSDHRAAGHAAH